MWTRVLGFLGSPESVSHIHGFAPRGVTGDVLFELVEGNPKSGVWDFEEAERHCIYDDPPGCIEKLRILQEKLPYMEQCILEFNRRGRIPNELVMDSMRLFTDKVRPALATVGAAS